MADPGKTITKQVLDFFNRVESPEEIVGLVRDDPAFGKRGYGIRPSLARRILAVRNSLPGRRFKSIRQLDEIPGMGPDTLHDVIYSFRRDGPADRPQTGDRSFRVEIEGITPSPFLEVTGLESVIQIIESSDGDQPVIRKTPGRTTCSNIVLRREFTGNDELWQWHKKAVDGSVERKAISIIITGKSSDEIARYNLFEAWPCRWKTDSLEAEGREFVIEETELAIEKIERG